MRVRVPPGFLAERRYVVETVLGDLLGYPDLAVEPDDVPDWVVELPDNRRLVLRDAFFRHLDEQRWLQEVRCPDHVAWFRHDLTEGESIPIPFGDSGVDIGPNEVRLGSDLFAAVFFMLTRWEELVSAERDRHGRFPAAASLAVRAGFVDRPVVEAWARTLGQALDRLGCPPPRLPHYRLFHTHDVDEPATFLERRAAFRASVGSLLKRRDPTSSWLFLRVGLGLVRDPLDSFNELMDVSEQLGVRSIFYFLAEGAHPLDASYPLDHPRIATLLEGIRARGHAVGLHSGYATLDDEDELAAQKQRLERRWGSPVTEARQHFLRFQAPRTWRALERAGFHVDASCGFAEREGFRCGTGTPYRVFDVEQRRRLTLVERPLVVMDGTLSVYTTPPSPEVLARLRALHGAAHRCGSGFTMLVHNSFPRYPAFATAYRAFIQEIRAGRD